MLNREAEATSNIDPFVFKAVWLQKLDLPVDLDDLKPLPDSIRKSFEISPESLFKSTTIINTKSISSTSTSTSSNQSSNTMIGSKDGKAMIRFSAWSIPILSSYRKDIDDRFEQKFNQEKINNKCDSVCNNDVNDDDDDDDDTKTKTKSNNGKNPFASMETLMSKISEIKETIETEDLGSTSDDEDKIWDKDIRKERKIKRMLRRAKEQEPKDHGHCHEHSHSHGHGHGHNHHEHEHDNCNSKTNNKDSLFKKTLLRRHSSSEEPFPLLLNKKFSFAALEACVLTMKPGERAIFILSPTLAASLINLECTIRSTRSGTSMSKCASQFMQMQEMFPDLSACQGLPAELHIELSDLHFYDDDVKGSGNVSTGSKFNGWKEKDVWQYSPAERWINAINLKSKANEEWKIGRKESAVEIWKKSLEFLESLERCKVILDWKDDLRHRKAYISKAKAKGKIDIVEADLISESCDLGSNVVISSLQEYESLLNSIRSNLSLYFLGGGQQESGENGQENLKNVIKLCTSILATDPENSKALFRRGKAYRLIGRDLDLAHLDLQRVLDNDNLDPAVQAEIQQLSLAFTRAERKEQLLYQNAFKKGGLK